MGITEKRVTLGNVAQPAVVTATTAPGVTDDMSAGYIVGDMWIDTSGPTHYQCVATTTDAASWSLIETNADVTDATNVNTAGAVMITDKIAPISRYSTPADSQLTGSGMGATTETIHTALTLTSADLATARRFVKYSALFYIDGQNSTDTWTFKLKLGGISGTQLFTSGAIDLTAAGDIYLLEGWFQIRTVGSGGTFDWRTTFTDVINDSNGGGDTNVAGAVNTTGTNTLVCTGESSTNNAGQQVTLRHFWAEVWPE